VLGLRALRRVRAVPDRGAAPARVGGPLMCPAARDPVIRGALNRMKTAAELLARARRELRRAMRDLEKHPDFIDTESIEELRYWKGYSEEIRRGQLHGRREDSSSHLTLAWWTHNCILSVLREAPLDEAAGWIAEDEHPERSLREWIQTEKREARAIAKRARSRAA